MKVWGNHTQGMDHLHLRAVEQISGSRTLVPSSVSDMHDLPLAAQRKAQYEQRAQGSKMMSRSSFKKSF